MEDGIGIVITQSSQNSAHHLSKIPEIFQGGYLMNTYTGPAYKLYPREFSLMNLNIV